MNFFFFFFFKQKTAYEMLRSLVGSEMCIRDRSTTNADQKVTVTLDDQNKGYAWVDGLPQGKVKAVLRQSPATYKIPAQKTESGTDVPEGTLIYDKDTKTISIMLGREYNDQDPK